MQTEFIFSSPNGVVIFLHLIVRHIEDITWLKFIKFYRPEYNYVKFVTYILN